MNIDDLLLQPCPWLRGKDADNDVVISSRIRLARNLVGFPFPIRATEHDRRLIRDTVKHAIAEIFPENEYCFVDIQTLSTSDKEFLQERQLISPELVESNCSYAALIDRNERYCVLVNSEDHLRIHAIESGLVPQKVWEQVSKIDDQFSSKLDYVFHTQYGFLTSRATNAGTGMKISMMLHLPALVATNELDKVARSLLKKNVVVSGLYGSPAHGDFFQAANRVTLGKSEEELISKMTDLIPQIVGYERQARNFLLKSRRDIILDRCNRAVGVLRTARTISGIETMRHLSSLRLGIFAGLLEGFDIAAINSLLLYTQPAHLQKMQGAELSQVDQDIARATYIRQKIG
jgi:protein arginine kinase